MIYYNIKCDFKKNITLFLLALLSVGLSAQQDTLYFGEGWKPTVKDSASFFRPPIKKQGELFIVKDYFISGQLQMEGLSKSDEKDIWQGQTTWYNKDGSIYQQGNYTDGKLNGDFVSILNNKKLIAEFKNSNYVSGERNINCGGGIFLYTKSVGDTIVEVMHADDIKGLRYETYRSADYKKGTYFIKYYGKEGTYIGQRRITKDSYAQGTEVDYYRNPMRVREIRYYNDEGQVFSSDYYYENGQVREKFDKTVLSKTFYSADGQELSILNYQLNKGRLKPFNGSHYYFYYGYNNQNNELIQSIRTYREGRLEYEEFRYKNQTPKSKAEYEAGKKIVQISFDETGKEIAQITYENYLPLNGTEIIGDRQTTYEDGKMVSEITYYPTTQIKLSEKTPETETFYDKQGKLLGVLNFDTTDNYAKPYEGQRFIADYQGDISSIEEYKGGFLSKRTSFRKRRVDDSKSLIHKHIEIFEEGGFNRTKEIAFYSNGQKQSEIDYKGYYETFGTFFDKEGIVLGSYDYKKKDGVLYKFFGDADPVKLMEVRKEGKLLKSKVYTYAPNTRGAVMATVLVEEFDIDCCAKFYTPDGNVIAEYSLKDQEAWEGTIYNTNSRQMYTLKEGKRNGAYKKYDYSNKSVLEQGQYENDMAFGTFEYFNYQGGLERTEQYKNDKLNGKTTYFDGNGKEIAKLIYEDGKPMDGILLRKAFSGKLPNEETYENGKLIKRVSQDPNGKRITKFVDGKETETIAYYKDSDTKRLSYSVENGYINGEVVRYDKKGVETGRGIFENGKFREGIVFMHGTSVKGKPDHIILERGPDVLKVTFMGQNDKVLFQSEENLAFGVATVFTQQLGIYMDFLNPSNLY